MYGAFVEWTALAVILLVIYGLMKRYETRLVLLGAGLFLCLISWNLMSGLTAFGNAMTNKSLIMSICSSMGFAYVARYTNADRSLVHYLATPIRGLGIFLIPICTVITFCINIAIPSAAGCAAAVGSTLIPVMLRAGIRPAGAAAAVLAGTVGSYLSPGTSHNPFIAEMAGISVVDFISYHAPYSIMVGVFGVVGTLIACILFKDHKGDVNAQVDSSKLQNNADFTPNPVMAIVPIVPLAILVVGNVWVPAIKMDVAPAMIIGGVIALLLGMIFKTADPQKFTSEFFNGMGKGYADVMGIIIAAGVFAAGLQAAGLIDTFVTYLKESNDVARWGGSIGPFFMGVLTGSGDAATLAFNQTVTPHAEQFGMTIESLGALAYLAGAAGRTASPLAGVTILVSGIAMCSPVDVIKRTAVPMFLAVITLAFVLV